MVADEARGRLVLHGGRNREECGTWEWDGGSWRLVASGDEPVWRSGHAMAWDSLAGRVLLDGGDGPGECCADLHAWDGGGWRVLCEDGCPGPGSRSSHAVAFDRGAGELVLLDARGGEVNQTWTWSAAGWDHRCDGIPPSDACPELPSRRFYTSLAYDEAREDVLLYGGNAGSDETWAWDGDRWTRRVPQDPEGDGDPPPLETTSSLVYHPTRRRVALLGLAPEAGDVWEWDGASWALNRPADIESDGNPTYDGWNPKAAAMAYHGPSDRVVAYTSVVPPGTWEWDAGGAARPGHVLRVRLSEAGATGRAHLTSLSVAWTAGGVGYPDDVETRGARLVAWEHGRFVELDHNAAGADGPGPLAATVDDSEAIDRVLSGEERELLLAVTPSAPNGERVGRIATAYAEVSAAYYLSTCEAETPRGEPCEDGDPATTGTVCAGGRCVAGDPLCRRVPDGTPCDDGDPASERSACSARECVAAAGFCSRALPGDPCDLGDPALAGWACLDGACVEGTTLPRLVAITEGRPWAGAREVCEAQIDGGRLVGLRSPAEHLALAELVRELPTSVWVGLSDVQEDGLFAWTGGAPATFVQWRNAREPSADGEEDCVEYEPASPHIWVGSDCSAVRPFVCERPTPCRDQPALTPCEPMDPDVLDPVCYAAECVARASGPHYLLLLAEASWAQARSACEAWVPGGHLVTITDAVERDLVGSLLGSPHPRAWIGLSRPEEGADLMWVDGAPLEFADWVPGEPILRDSYGCAFYFEDSPRAWRMAPCSFAAGYVCERDD